MKLIYLDEAGNTGKKCDDPQQPVHLIGSLIFDDSQVSEAEQRLNAIADDCASTLYLAKKSVAAAAIEFHGSELFGGKGTFKGLAVEKRYEICELIIQACATANAIYGWSAVDKPKLWKGHPHMICFQFTLERVQDFLKNKNDLGLLVADEHQELEDAILKDLAFSKEFSTGWGYRPTKIVNIVDTVHFVKSKHNRIIQACDVLTYLKLKYVLTTRRLVASYMASGAKTLGYPAYVEANTNPWEKEVSRLNTQIAEITNFGKIWPTSN